MWKKIGEVAVDTGRIWIVDPVYVDRVDEAEDWSRGAAQLLNHHDVDLGAVVGTGAGDGVYDIMAKHGPNGSVAAIRIDFLEFKSHGIVDSTFQ